MTDAPQVEHGPPPPKEPGVKPIDILSGKYGFHFSIDEMLPDHLQHGLLSRYEERKRGLGVRKRESRSPGDTIFFTPRANNLYMRHDPEDPKSERELAQDTFAFVIDRPDFSYKAERWFGMTDVVEMDDVRALMFIDRLVEPKGMESRDALDTHKVGHPLPSLEVDTRVAFLRRACEIAGRNIPIYGLSGDQYWPVRTQHNEIRSILRSR